MMRRFWLRKAISLALCASIIFSCFALVSAAAAEDRGITNAKVVLRKSASKEAAALQTVPKGEDVTILSASGSWYKVRYGSFTGYMMKQYVDKAKSASSSSSSSSAAEKIKALGSAPGIMRVGDENSDVKKLQQALQILGYYDGKIDGVYGSGTTAAVEAYQKAHKLEADGYAGAATVTSIFGSCNKKSLTTQPEPGSSQSASAAKSESKYPTVSSISEIGSAPAATREGDSGNNVVKLQQALECLGYYSGAIDGVYGEGTVASVKKFQKKRNMKEDGIAGSATIRVIFGATASAGASSASSQKTAKTEVLDWFADNVSSVIPKNARFTIKDVKTGKTFEAVRWSGVNHLDAEPRTAEDTATMKSIFGGSWSWNRRAILIQYNGHVYAASMNGMPHGTSTISNGFDGHFCIHFKNSKTHGTKKVDDDHQSAVTTASKATW